MQGGKMTEKTSDNTSQAHVLAINAGSSSIRFALYQIDKPPARKIYGKVDRISLTGANLIYSDLTNGYNHSLNIKVTDHKSAAAFLIEWLEKQEHFSTVQAVGHRVVHGMDYTEPQTVTPEVLKTLHRISSYDPDHLPREIELIEILRERHPELPQVACFDTAFHSHLPRIARLLPIPRRYDKMGIQRYGFHGLSYAFLIQELARVAGARAAQGRVILGHLGSGASLAAVRDGRSIDTTMAFTPAGGLPMSTRSGDLDPGVAWYLMQTEKLTPAQFNYLINHESGLLGVSETSSDMRDLLERQADDIRAAEAVELFCYQTRKWIGALAAALGGLDTLVFAGGIGEHAGEIRARICSGLGFLGIELDEKQNASDAGLISTKDSEVAVRVIRTDEELMIANAVCGALNLTIE